MPLFLFLSSSNNIWMKRRRRGIWQPAVLMQSFTHEEKSSCLFVFLPLCPVGVRYVWVSVDGSQWESQHGAEAPWREGGAKKTKQPNTATPTDQMKKILCSRSGTHKHTFGATKVKPSRRKPGKPIFPIRRGSRVKGRFQGLASADIASFQCGH